VKPEIDTKTRARCAYVYPGLLIFAAFSATNCRRAVSAVQATHFHASSVVDASKEPCSEKMGFAATSRYERYVLRQHYELLPITGPDEYIPELRRLGGSYDLSVCRLREIDDIDTRRFIEKMGDVDAGPDVSINDTFDGATL
jgi:hypothetical protein